MQIWVKLCVGSTDTLEKNRRYERKKDANPEKNMCQVYGKCFNRGINVHKGSE